MTITELCKKAHRIACIKGFWGGIAQQMKGDTSLKDVRNNGELIALIHSELSEALEALRHNNWDNVAEEMADTMIRIGDFCEARDIDLEEAINKKMRINKKRKYKHGKEF